jgi:2Fe-2S ferredoxin
MTTINFTTPDGSRHAVTAADGQSLMQTARAAGLQGIVAECNGNASCATCHVYIEEATAATLPPPSEQEEDLLTFTASERKIGSRLSCQVVVGPELDGMEVEIPPSQV